MSFPFDYINYKHYIFRLKVDLYEKAPSLLFYIGTS